CWGRWRAAPEEPEDTTFLPPPLAGGGGAKRRRNRKTPPFCLPRLPGEVARSAGGTGRRHLFASPACRGRWREAPEGAGRRHLFASPACRGRWREAPEGAPLRVPGIEGWGFLFRQLRAEPRQLAASLGLRCGVGQLTQEGVRSERGP